MRHRKRLDHWSGDSDTGDTSVSMDGSSIVRATDRETEPTRIPLAVSQGLFISTGLHIFPGLETDSRNGGSYSQGVDSARKTSSNRQNPTMLSMLLGISGLSWPDSRPLDERSRSLDVFLGQTLRFIEPKETRSTDFLGSSESKPTMISVSLAWFFPRSALSRSFGSGCAALPTKRSSLRLWESPPTVDGAGSSELFQLGPETAFLIRGRRRQPCHQVGSRQKYRAP